MHVGSLCTGYGGIELGLTQIGEDVDLRWYAEIEPALIDPSRDVWHPGVPNHGDITAINWSDVEPVDLIVGGIPCQPTSSAGRRLGDADPRWLWPYVRTVLGVLRPARFLFENVRGLVSFEKGRLFDGILSDLVALGYDVRWLTLGACAVGLAHHRHRVFVLAECSDASTIQRLDVVECGARRRQDRRRLLPTPTARDGSTRGEGSSKYWAERWQQQPERATKGVPLGAALNLSGSQWAQFGDAIQRHMLATGIPPCEPTEPNRNGSPRLRAEFVEWLMAVPTGHVTNHLDRKSALKALGNGVSPPQLAQAWRLLTRRQRVYRHVAETPPSMYDGDVGRAKLQGLLAEAVGI